MNWYQIEGNWKHLKGNVKQQWGMLTDDELEMIAGKRAQLVGKLQEVYGIKQNEAEQQLLEWQKLQKDVVGTSPHRIDLNKHIAGSNRNMIDTSEYVI